MPDINDLRASLSAANTAMGKLQVANAILALRLAPSEQYLSYEKHIRGGGGAPGMLQVIAADPRLNDGEADKLLELAKQFPFNPARRVTKKEANEAYDQLSYATSSFQEHMDVELMRADVHGRMDPLIAKVKELMALGWPAGMVNPEGGLLDKAQAILDRYKALKENGMTGEVGRGEAEQYLRTVKMLAPDRVAEILANPTSVQQSPSFMGRSAIDIPRYTMDYLNAEADKALQEPAAVERDDPLVLAGFKKVNDYTWSKSVETEPGTVKLFNVRYAGTPRLYRLTASVSFPGKGITGAATRDIGQYQTAEEAVSAYESESSAVAPAQKDPKMTRQEAIRYISQADYLPFPMVEQARAGFPEIAADVDYLNEVDDRVVKADSAKIEAIAARYEGERDMMGLISRAREAVLPDVGPFDPDLGDPFGGSGSRTWLVTNARGYRKQHKADTMVGAIQLGMNDVDYTLESSEWTAVEAEGDTVPSLVPPPVETPAEDVERSADATFLQSMITGAINLLDENLITKLEPMFEKYASDDAMMDMLGKAAEAYSAAATEAAKAAMK
jgi:hypothetical protein